MRRIAMFAPHSVRHYFTRHNRRHSIYVSSILVSGEIAMIAFVHVEVIFHLIYTMIVFGHELGATVLGETKQELVRVEAHHENTERAAS